MPASLFIFGGLPGSGKTTLARRLAKHLSAVYLRIDTVEQILIASPNVTAVDALGYDVACNIAKDNLQLGVNVVADSVNSIELSRMQWRDVARQSAVPFYEFEVSCSDTHEHKAGWKTEWRIFRAMFCLHGNLS